MDGLMCLHLSIYPLGLTAKQLMNFNQDYVFFKEGSIHLWMIYSTENILLMWKYPHVMKQPPSQQLSLHSLLNILLPSCIQATACARASDGKLDPCITSQRSELPLRVKPLPKQHAEGGQISLY